MASGCFYCTGHLPVTVGARDPRPEPQGLGLKEYVLADVTDLDRGVALTSLPILSPLSSDTRP